MARDERNITIEIQASVETRVEPSERVCAVAGMFGLGVDERKTIELIPLTKLTLGPGRLIFVTGASGGGKTTLLRKVKEAVKHAQNVRVIDFDDLDWAHRVSGGDEPLVDALGGTIEESVRWLSLAGLNDAHVMLRGPGQLSDGQRYRWRLSQAMRQAERQAEGSLTVVLADEFGATLDRLTAMIIARNVRKWTSRSGICMLAATTHDDLLESLDPDTLIVQHPGSRMEVLERGENRTASGMKEMT